MASRGNWRRGVRIGLWSLVGMCVAAAAAGTIAVLRFDPDSLKPRIEAAVKRATGRDLTLQGRIRLGLSLQPTLMVDKAGFANPPGFSRPEMATLERLDLKLRLLPLLSNRIEIDRLDLVGPDIMLETDAAGRPNWQFTREAGPPPPPPPAGTQPAGTQPDAAQERPPAEIAIDEIRITDGTLTWRDGRTGRSIVVALAELSIAAASRNADMEVAGTASYNGSPFTLAGRLGSLARLQEPAATTPWPVQIQMQAAGASIAVDGTFSQPLVGRGYHVKLTATVPDVAALAPFLPGWTLPPLRDVALAAQLADTGTTLPEVSGVSLRIGRSDLAGIAPGLAVEQVDIAAPRLDQPVRIAAQGSLGGTPATMSGTLGTPAAMLPASAAPIPLDLAIQAAGSSLTMKGTLRRAADGRPSLQGSVQAERLDLDALAAALPRRTAMPAAAAEAPPTAAPSPAAPGLAAPPPPQARGGKVIPDTPIPFGLLRLADAALKLDIAQMTAGGAAYRAIAAQLDLQGGRLRLDPVSAELPAGRIDGALTADAAQAAPAVTLRLRAPALAVQALLAALRQPQVVTGSLNVQADLQGAGATPRAIAASLGGSLTLNMANGTVDNRILGGMLDTLLREASLLDLVRRGGTSQVQCFAAHLEARQGVVSVRPLMLVSSLLTMDGDGTANLGAETIDLRLRPQARVAGTGIVVPLRLSGTFRLATAAPDPAATVAENAGTVAGAVLGGATPLGLLAGALGGKQVLSGGDAECGAGASRQASPPLLQTPKLPNVGGVLKQLFR
ncbi:MAG: AsmA family protein [Acetobacteraceae bacterium]